MSSLCSLVRVTVLSVLISIAVGMFGAPEVHAAATNAVARAKDKSLLDYYKAGGVLMHPLTVALCGVLALVIYHARLLRAGKLVPAKDAEALRAMLYNRDLNAAYAYCEQHPNFFTTAVLAGVSKLNPTASDLGKGAAEAAMIDAVDQQETRMSFWLNLISVIAALSPMLGLLGTVQGMIGAFDKISEGSMGKPELLAGDIGVALITTFYGLCVGIPAMLSFFIFRGRMNALLGTISAALTELLDLFTGEGLARRRYESRFAAAAAATAGIPAPGYAPQPTPSTAYAAQPAPAQSYPSYYVPPAPHPAPQAPPQTPPPGYHTPPGGAPQSQ
ncbi:MAG: MotA/TolQ/ExbB proton channel family protein [bacterium]|nr:MotA/TolQ/ExbB proton channel family protein [bacterium]